MTQSEHFFARARDRFVTITGPVDLGTQVVRNMGANLAPRYLFFSSGTFNYLSVGRALPVEAPFFYLGIAAGWWCLPAGRRRRFAKILAVLIICVLPAALTEAEPQALRASGASALLGLFSCLGLLLAAGVACSAIGVRPIPDDPDTSRRWQRRAKGVLAGAAVGVIACGTVLIVRYWQSEPLRSEWHQPILVRMGQWLGQHKGAWERVIVDPAGIQPYLYVAAFSGMSPQEFQAAPKEFTRG